MEMYQSEVLRTLNNNLANALGGNEVVYKISDLLEARPKKADPRSGDEIKEDIRSKLRTMGEQNERI